MNLHRQHLVIFAISQLSWGCADQGEIINHPEKPFVSIQWNDHIGDWPDLSQLRKVGMTNVGREYNDGINYFGWMTSVDASSGKIFLEFEVNPAMINWNASTEPSEIDILFDESLRTKLSIKSRLVSVWVDQSRIGLSCKSKGTRRGWFEVKENDLEPHPGNAYRVEVMPSSDGKHIVAVKLIRGS